ncbi:probable LRR receptor-like serine/threonine-protein kinase At2g24230 isoform X1 [Amborella trichopoda]|nr:probable LRR receptor-like serine/threonine-protein kinase At2g24230 isoform X1 [Amborella trichopoda]|eukprot:XP_020517787.1 probable LRR receptor-like serine/threonine-protein kinase At2g24230 isoform X1 [Amborella trichopoda]
MAFAITVTHGLILLCEILLLLASLSLTEEVPCNSSDYKLVQIAFSSVTGFDLEFLGSNFTVNCSDRIREIKLPSKNLRGSVSWMQLKNLTELKTLDLSNNSLQGSIPGSFWLMPSVTHLDLSANDFGGMVGSLSKSQIPHLPLQLLNLSANRFTNSFNLSSFKDLRVLDLSNNKISESDVLSQISGLSNLIKLSLAGNNLQSLPSSVRALSGIQYMDLSNCNISGSIKPLSSLGSLTHLDISHNSMSGSFISDFPCISNLKFLNVSVNNFSGPIRSDIFKRFGVSAFIQSGICSSEFNSTCLPNPHKNQTHPKPSTKAKPTTNSRAKTKHKSRKGTNIAIIASLSSASFILALVIAVTCLYRRRRNATISKKWAIPKPPFTVKIEKSGPFSFETDSGTWVADIKEPSSVAVVMFEKPLISLTFSDLIAATGHFSKESQLAEAARSGPLYRVVLPGDMHVAIKVLENAREMDNVEAVAKLEELGRLKHPNVMPLLGYCIAGKEKLVLYEFMANGNLHQWLHELPSGDPNVEDWSMDTWEQQQQINSSNFLPSNPEKMGWLTRHRIAVGIARGLAFLHHAGSRPTPHGRVEPTTILLDESFEPRLAGCGLGSLGSQATESSVEADVYAFGVVLLELVTGMMGSEEIVAWVRGLVRAKQVMKLIDERLKRVGPVGEMVECVWVGYLCTAEVPEMRPTMQQVLGLLKDIRLAS